MKLSLICHNLTQLIVHPLDVSENLLNQPSGILSLVLLKCNLTLHLLLLIFLINLSYDLFTLCVLWIHLIGKLSLPCHLGEMMLKLTLNILIFLMMVLILMKRGIRGSQWSFRLDRRQVWWRCSVWCDKSWGIVKQETIRLLWYRIIKRDLRLLLFNPLCSQRSLFFVSIRLWGMILQVRLTLIRILSGLIDWLVVYVSDRLRLIIYGNTNWILIRHQSSSTRSFRSSCSMIGMRFSHLLLPALS